MELRATNAVVALPGDLLLAAAGAVHADAIRARGHVDEGPVAGGAAVGFARVGAGHGAVVVVGCFGVVAGVVIAGAWAAAGRGVVSGWWVGVFWGWAVGGEGACVDGAAFVAVDDDVFFVGAAVAFALAHDLDAFFLFGARESAGWAGSYRLVAVVNVAVVGDDFLDDGRAKKWCGW